MSPTMDIYTYMYVMDHLTEVELRLRRDRELIAANTVYQYIKELEEQESTLEPLSEGA